VKDIVYKTNWHALEELGNTCREMSAICSEELPRVCNIFRSCTECIRSGGWHFHLLLWHWWVLLDIQ